VSKKSIFLVDDDPTTGVIIEAMLEDQYSVSVFPDSESCLMGLDQEYPDLFVLDVELPGIDGYELCRRIRARPDSKFSPVIFLSSHDSPNAILSGYESGAQDYITKPFDHIVLDQKIENLLRIQSDRDALTAQVENSGQLASIFMKNLGDYSILINYLRSLNECFTHDDVVEATLDLLDKYSLSGIIQVRSGDGEKTVSRAGENWPMEVAVVSHVRTLGRIFEFKTRAVFNFDCLTVLVTNMPVSDSELCGRIRDSLAIVVESAASKLIALEAITEKEHLRAELGDILQQLTNMVCVYEIQYAEARFRSSEHTEQLVTDLQKILGPLGVNGEQEDLMLEEIHRRSDELAGAYDFGNKFKSILDGMQNKLGGLLAKGDSNGG
jgi:CheY-like chemotaxis protein